MSRYRAVLEAYGFDGGIETPIGAPFDVVERWRVMAEQHLYFFVAAVLLPPNMVKLGMEPMEGALARRGRLYPGGPERDFSFHMEFCRFLDEEASQPGWVHFEAPRDHYKTTCCAYGKILQELCKDPAQTFLLAAATMDRQAGPFLNRCKAEIEGNEVIRTLWPHMGKGKPWSTRMATIRNRPHGVGSPSITAVGEGGSAASGHFDWVLADDLVLEENTQTRERAAKTINWTQMLPPMVNQHFWFYGTRYKDYDAHGYWQEEMKDEFLYRSWSALYDDEGKPTLDIESAHVLFPEEWTREKFADRLGKMGVANFSAQYLNDPLPPDIAVLRPDWIEAAYYEDEDLPKSLSTYVAVDPSMGIGRDEAALAAVGIDADKTVWVLDVYAGQWTYRETTERFITQMCDRGAVVGVVESMGLGSAVEQLVREALTERALNLCVEYPHWHPTKEPRVHGTVEPLLEGKRLRIPRRLADSQLIQQMVRFPKGARDDQLDALTMATDCAIRYGFVGKRDAVVARPRRKVLLKDVEEGRVHLSAAELEDGMLYRLIMEDREARGVA